MKNQNELLVTESFFNTLEDLERIFNAKNCKSADIEKISDIEFKHSLKSTKNSYAENKYMHVMCGINDVLKLTTRTYSDNYTMTREYKLSEYGTELIMTREDKKFEV
jgi:hypothetical protein|tara:strand:+ start:391 stop:711 length:321 start_codon:yes stop_codon:yes gene_type:complete